MAGKQLIVVVDGTDALRPYWQTVVSDYLEKIVRCFCGNELNGQKLSEENHPEFALVVFNSHAPCGAFLVQRTVWTKDLDVFLSWLLRISFSGGGYGDAAIAEGLSDALKMFPNLTNGTQSLQYLDSQKHCILIAASNPYSLPTSVYSPALSTQLSENPEAHTGTCLSDAEGVANLFGQCCISLSVICPRQLPKLRAIYNAGRRNPRAADPTIHIAENSHFIVLISENFMEARAALSHPLMGNLTTSQGIVKADVVSSTVVSGPASTSVPSVNGSIINRQQSPLGTIAFATVEVEPTTVPPMVSGYGYPHLAPKYSVSSQGVSSLQTSSPSSTSQEIKVTNEVIQEHKPVVIPMSHTLHPVGFAQGNVNILNNFSQHRQVMNSASITEKNFIGLQTTGGSPMAMHISNMISSGALMPTVQVAQNTSIGTFTSTSSHFSGESNMGISPALTNLQNNIGMVQSVKGMGQGNRPQSAQTKQGEINMAPSLMNEPGPNSVSFAPGTMIPAPEVNPYTLWIKIWKGSLSVQCRRYPSFLLHLEGYGDFSASEMLVEDWPSSMQIHFLMAQDNPNWKRYVGEADILLFKVLTQRNFFPRLHEKKLCAVIKLASQTLLLSVSDKAELLIGILFPGHEVIFNRKVLSEQQQPMVGTGMNQTFVQGSVRPQMPPQAKLPSPGMPNGGFMP